MRQRSDRYGQSVLKLTEDDICFSAARLFFAYGLGNGMYFPLSAGAAAVLNPAPPTPQNGFQYLEKLPKSARGKIQRYKLR